MIFLQVMHVWLVVWIIFLVFNILGIIIPTGLSYFSEGLKPPTRCNYRENHPQHAIFQVCELSESVSRCCRNVVEIMFKFQFHFAVQVRSFILTVVCWNYFGCAKWGIMWVKQCHLHRPPVIIIFIGGMYKPFPVMGGRHGIVLPTLNDNVSWSLFEVASQLDSYYP